MSLDLNEIRKLIADHLQSNFHKARSIDSAIMAAIVFAYEAGLRDRPEDSGIVDGSGSKNETA
jgi:hypothetical protein